MNDKLLVETASLAGEIMLASGAEIYRVEDTINRILAKAEDKTADTLALVTGIFTTLNSPHSEAITTVKRINRRSTNLNRIYLVNDVSRRLCGDVIAVEDAYEELKKIQTVVLYRPWKKNLALVGVPIFFAMLLGGGFMDCLAAGMIGCCLMLATVAGNRFRLNDFCSNSLGAFVIAFAAMALEHSGMRFHQDLAMIASIMPLVPGVIFTTAIRDTLNGDYSAGMARILEAVVIALAVAAGAGSGMAVFHWIAGGLGL